MKKIVQKKSSKMTLANENILRMETKEISNIKIPNKKTKKKKKQITYHITKTMTILHKNL